MGPVMRRRFRRHNSNACAPHRYSSLFLIVSTLGFGLVGISAPSAGAGESPDVSVGDASIVEGDVGSPRVLHLPVTLSTPSASAVTVDYVLTAGTAAADDFDDRRGKGRTLTFKPSASTGATAVTRQIAVKITADQAAEGNEFFTLTLSNPSGGYSLGRAMGIGTIIDDDTPHDPSVSVGDAGIVEGDDGRARDLHFAVSLSEPSTTTVVVSYAFAAGSAVAPDDFDNRAGKTKTLRFGVTRTGKTAVSKQIAVKVAPDQLVEGDETLTVTLSSATGGFGLSLIARPRIGFGRRRDRTTPACAASRVWAQRRGVSSGRARRHGPAAVDPESPAARVARSYFDRQLGLPRISSSRSKAGSDRSATSRLVSKRSRIVAPLRKAVRTSTNRKCRGLTRRSC